MLHYSALLIHAQNETLGSILGCRLKHIARILTALTYGNKLNVVGHIIYQVLLPTSELLEQFHWHDLVLLAGEKGHLVHYPLHTDKLSNLLAVSHSNEISMQKPEMAHSIGTAISPQLAGAASLGLLSPPGVNGWWLNLITLERSRDLPNLLRHNFRRLPCAEIGPTQQGHRDSVATRATINLLSDSCDGIRNVALRPQWRTLWAINFWEL